MFSSLFKANSIRLRELVDSGAVSKADRNVAAFATALAQLRRHKNSLQPLSKLPAELITEIITILIEKDIDAVADALDGASTHHHNAKFFTWLPATQFCTHWRDVALNNKGLWTHIWMTNVELFKAFLERSGDMPLHIDTWRNRASASAYDQMSSLLAENMHRVRSLRIWRRFAGHKISRIHGRPAPKLEVLELHGLRSRRVRRSNREIEFRAPDLGVMPKLRRLKIQSCLQKDWAPLLPSSLPTVTHLSIKCFYRNDQLDLLRRCKRVRHLSMEIIGTSPSIPEQNSTSIGLSHITHLNIDTPSWDVLKKESLHSIQQAHILIFPNSQSFRVQDAYQAFQGLLEHRRALPQGSQEQHDRLSLTWTREDRFILKLRDATGKDVVTLDTPIKGPHIQQLFVEGLIWFTNKSNVDIEEIDVGYIPKHRVRSDIHRLFSVLAYATRKTVIHLRTMHVFVSFLGSWTKRAPTSRQGHRDCSCEECEDVPHIGYLGLEMLILDIGELFFHEDNEEILEIFLDWLKERQLRGWELKTLKLRYIGKFKKKARLLQAQASPFVTEVQLWRQV
ncbi:hypothetical protein AX16_004067 [Volvariella volvacea WC 439]|nr:hypothetical protein AX16_004067 [Volvariella volvacea WC 439]